MRTNFPFSVSVTVEYFNYTTALRSHPIYLYLFYCFYLLFFSVNTVACGCHVLLHELILRSYPD